MNANPNSTVPSSVDSHDDECLSKKQIAELLDTANGRSVLLCLLRDGRVKLDDAIDAVVKSENSGRAKARRLYLALDRLLLNG